MEKINIIKYPTLLWNELSLKILALQSESLNSQLFSGDISYHIWRWKKSILKDKIDQRLETIEKLKYHAYN